MSDNRELDQALIQRAIPAVGPDGQVLGDKPRKAAAGKALIVYLLSGSAGLAIVVFLLLKGTGCG